VAPEEDQSLELSRPADLDLLAASLRADLTDLAAFVEGLAVKLEESLGGVVTVERVKQGFRGPKIVRKISLSTSSGDRLELRREGQTIQTIKARTSGGIVLKSEVVDIDSWLAALTTAVAAEASHNERTRQALQRLLLDQ
jgi:hypothetical protein